jgi:hypothetical protein
MDEITFSGQVSYEELHEAKKVILKLDGKSYKILLIIIYLCMFSLIVTTIIHRFFPTFETYLNGGRQVSPLPFPIVGFLVFFFLAVLLPLFTVWIRRREKKAYLENKFASSMASYILSKDAFISEGKYGKLCIPWEDFHHWRETPRFFLFFQTQYQAIVFPKRFLQESEQAQLRLWLSNATTSIPKRS